MVWVGAGCGCGLDRVWIGLDPGLDRPRSGLTCLCMLQLGRSMTRKGRQGVQAASVQLGFLLCSYSPCQAAKQQTVVKPRCQAVKLPSCTCRKVTLLSSQAVQQPSCNCCTSKLSNYQADTFTSCKASLPTNNMQPSLDQTSTHQYIISFQRSGSKVWIKSFRKVWIGGLDRRSGSCVGTGLDPDLTF